MNIKILEHTMQVHLNIEADEMVYTIEIQDNTAKIKNKEEWNEPEHNPGSYNPIFVEIEIKGNITLQTKNLEGQSLPWFDHKLGYYTDYFNEFEVLGIIKPILQDGKTIGFINAAMTYHHLNDFKNSVFKTTFPVLIFGILLAYFGGLALAKRSLLPFQNLSSQIKNIRGKKLQSRIHTTVEDVEIVELVTEINNLLQRIEQSFDILQRFAADASHELKNPIAIIKNELSNAMASENSNHFTQTIESVYEEIIRLENTTDAFTNLAMMESEETKFLRNEVWLNDVIFQQLSRLKILIQQKSISIDNSKVASTSCIGDERWLSMLIRNILDNAIHYSENSGKIKISLQHYDNWINITIRDFGQGVAEEELNRLTERFYRTKKEKLPFGIGLGLSICHWIVKKHNGKMEITNANPGLSVSIKIPIS
ncbi:MAG: HAMP domain-containing histidine kinase [Candidatus Marinimicrobia bacterium]|nr:HAMP domain-containing histidine kinase [Candidatus Neomarinimicrobiota bacterium]MBL7109769.1 HAMP domain-containing histidine kinase [Candidatus Neomarinimicrobiota bacterium]